MKKRTIFLAIATVLLLLAGGIGINKLCQKTVPAEQPPRQKQLYPPFVYKPDSATRARWEKLNPSEQKELEFRKFEDYMSDFDSRKFTLDEPNIVLEPNPMAKLKGYEEYKADEDYKYPFDYIWYPGMHIHGMTKEQVLEKYKDNRMVSYGEADTFRYGIHIEHQLYFPFIAFMVSDLYYAEISRCFWYFRRQGYPITRVVYFIRDGNVQRACFGYEINLSKYTLD
ncbi:hypothetical protein [Bacteroides sp. Marseille-P3684]|uniref:hypothetical protein n=1 Tax=Bacteroides sp. Marseille-P3684 TaxID=2086579 RepID=UPI000D0B5101|nr:hypothetical protein [Bacteroides sp. Marseille-P3684]